MELTNCKLCYCICFNFVQYKYKVCFW